MTDRYLGILRTVFVTATVAALVCVPLTTALAQKTLDDRHQSNELRTRDFRDVNTGDDDSDVRRPTTYARSNYLWQFSTGPSYTVENPAAAGVLDTQAGSFQLQQPLLVASELTTAVQLDRLGGQYFVVQTHPDLDVSAELTTTIQAAGGRIVGSPNADTLIALLNRSAYDVASGAVGVTKVIPYQAAFKLDPSIGRTPLPDPVKALSEIYELRVGIWEGEDSAAVAEAIIALGGNVKWVGNDSLVVEMNRSLLAALAALEPVNAITEQLPNFPLAEETTTVMQTGQWNAGAIPYHDAAVDGGGGATASPQVLMVLDSGIQLDNGDLSHERTEADEGGPNLGGPTHRKVRVYQSTAQFGGQGDLNGCDAGPQGGFTHGHVVSAGALGNATAVGPEYNGGGWNAFDQFGNPWALDGVADHAVLIAYDGQITPPNGSCSDPLLSSISPGDLYGLGNSGSLGRSYVHTDANTPQGARVVNFSWGNETNTYNADAQDIDRFMNDKKDALVFVSAGNAGSDNDNNNIPDPETIGAPATTRNGLAIGASRNANTVNSPESREFFSSVGPAVNTQTNRIAPQLMAPGGEPGAGSLGISSEFSCRSLDNNSANPVECDITDALEGTSFASPAAAGAALVVRDYFAQGYYPEAEADAGNSANVSAALVKAVLIASADFMTGANTGAGGGTNNFAPYRWNNYQGYGRIQLDQALPISTWPTSPSGLAVHDPWSGTSDIGLSGSVSSNQTTTSTFKVCNGREELRIALAWTDNIQSGTSPALRNNMDLTVFAPSGKEYRGNYFTDDGNLNGSIDAGEDCGALGSSTPNTPNGLIDAGEWSLQVCNNTGISGRGLIVNNFDNANPTEAIFLSPDPDDDDVSLEGLCTAGSDRELMCSGYDPQDPVGTLIDCDLLNPCPVPQTCTLQRVCDNDLDCRADGLPSGTGQCENPEGYRQTEEGEWTISIKAGNSFHLAQDYAVAIAGGVCLGSSVRFDEGQYTCNQAAVIAVNELAETGSPGDVPDAAAIKARTTVNVVDVGADGVLGGGDDTVMDTETDLDFVQVGENALKFETDPPIGLTDGTAPDPGNGVLDVRSGNVLVVEYQDINPDGGGPGQLRTNVATVNCEVNLGFGSIVFNQFGQDTSVLVQGGCERNVRGNFEFGFPDRYMDAGESIIYNFAFNSNENVDLEAVEASLACVGIDDDSPVDCLPSGAGCIDGLASGGGNCPGTSAGDVCDPRRENNPPCPWVDVLDSPKNIGFVPAGVAMSANFSLQLAGDGLGEPFDIEPRPTVEMLLELTAATSGKTSTGLAAQRHTLNVDTVSEMYSTDFPDGGMEVQDEGPGVVSNNDELALDPVTENSNFQSNDYRFETFDYSAMTDNGKNAGLLTPWNFDGNDGGMKVGLAGPTDETAADIFNIANFGEDKNFNGFEDGICLNDPAQACYHFGINTDPRCGVGGECQSVENNLGGTGFTKSWNTKGGCGWQTKPPGVCSADANRGCFINEDCKGVCQVINNEVASTFDPCGSVHGGCPPAHQCSDVIPNPNPLDPCVDDTDCGSVLGACVEVLQTCLGDGGTCDDEADFQTGGIWHTGQIGAITDACDGTQASACANYKVVTGVGGQLTWWELLVTPVMEKVNQDDDPETGLPTHTIEIFDMGWNTAINLRDNNAAYTWELDTDTTTLDPVDLFADNTILNIGGGGYGAVINDNNPALTGGFPLFAPIAECWTRTPVTGDPLANLGRPCMVNEDCEPGVCNAGGDGSALGLSCTFDVDCGAVNGAADPTPGDPDGEPPHDNEGDFCVSSQTCQVQAGGLSVNGSLGGDRVGKNSCFFEGTGTIPPGAQQKLGFAGPFDDDWNQNIGVCTLTSNLGNLITCRDNKDCEVAGNIGPCNFAHPEANATTDEYVKDYGPYRNHDIVAWNGPDMRFFTLEDLFGDTGNTFQASIGFINFEGTATNQAQQSYGMGIDDLVIKWREFSLTEDVTDCLTSGACATIELATSNVFEGQTVLTVTVLEATPDAVNDCDLEGPEGPSDNDCDNNGTPDVVAKATSEAEIDGEILFLNQTDNDPNEYKGQITISSLGDNPGVLFIADQGGDNPTVTVTYKDLDDGTGNPCPNAVDPARHGNVTSSTTIFLGDTCEVAFVGYRLEDNGDGDDFVDTNETTSMFPSLINNCGEELHNCTARISTNSDTVDCILKSVIDLGTLLDIPDIVDATDDWVWKMANVSRANPTDDFPAEFLVTLQCDEIDGVSVQQKFNMQLDIDLDDGGQTPQTWAEQFESATLGKFMAENLDAGIPGDNNAEGLINGDGYRCAYANPDWPNANSYGSDQALDCFPAQTMDQADDVFWDVDGTTTGSPDSGRAWNGSYSMYYGVYLTDPAGNFSSPAATIESVRTTDPINLATGSPELSFWHINSLLDGRILTIDPIWSADRGVVQVQLAAELSGDPITEWIRLEPFQNSYDTQGFRNYFNCMFDPIDDGNDEDDYFDDTDPDRADGPSSTCFPNFNYSCLGDSLNPFSTESICNATTAPLSTESPAANGGFGTGTWVKSKFDLSQYKGNRVRIRFLVSALKATAENWEAQFMNNPNPGDDGWWVDNVQMTNTFTNPVHILVDNDVVGTCSISGEPCVAMCNLTEEPCDFDTDCPNHEENNPCVAPCPNPEGECTGPPQACGEVCEIASLIVDVQTDPDDTGGPLDELLAGPGSPIELNAVGSSGTCLSGSLQYRYVHDVSEVELRGWSEDPIFIDAPVGDTDYRVEIRCSTDTGCMKSALVDVNVNCPSTGTIEGTVFSQGPIYALDKDTFGWGGGFAATSLPFDVWKGDLQDLGDLGAGGLLVSGGTGDSFDDPEPLAPGAAGDGRYYIVRDGYCNAPGSWESDGTNRDGQLP